MTRILALVMLSIAATFGVSAANADAGAGLVAASAISALVPFGATAGGLLASKTARFALRATSGLCAPAIIHARTLDQMVTFEQATRDATGAFLNGELQRLDPTLNEPLISITWERDIDLREDVQMGDTESAFFLTSYGSNGGGGKNWLSTSGNAPASVTLDMGKKIYPLTEWATELKWTVYELASAEKTGRPIDVQKFNAMNRKWQMDSDEQVYIGDPQLKQYGMLNNPLIPAGSVPNGAGDSPLFVNKTADEIVADINLGQTTAWAASAYARCPSKCIMPPDTLSYLTSRKVSEAGNMSLLNYIVDNSICKSVNNRPLEVVSAKFANIAGTNGGKRMMFYSQDKDLIRFPRVQLQRTPVEYRSLYQLTTYYGKLGAVEIVYPETVSYLEGF